MKTLVTILSVILSLTGACQITQIYTGTNTGINNISAVNNNILVNGDQNFLANCYNAANSLDMISLPVPANYVNYITRPDPLTIYMVSSKISPGSFIHKSIDGGNNWVKKLDSANRSLIRIDFFSVLEGFAIGIPYTFFRTRDGGNTWTSEAHEFNGATCLTIFGDSTLAVGDGNGAIYLSKDRGNTFTDTGGGFASSWTTDVFFMNKDTLFAIEGQDYSGDPLVIARSYNSGQNWQYFNIPAFYCGAVVFKNPSEGYVVGSTTNSTSVILKTTDMGETWTSFYPGFNSQLSQIVFLNDSMALVGGNNGVLFKWNSKASVFTDVKDNAPDNLQLKSYPNPVTDKLNLDLSGANSQDLKVNITDILGQNIFSLKEINSKQEIDVSNYSTGVYFLKVQNGSGQKVFKIVKE